MDQLPGNSHNQQRREPEEPKKIEKVVAGEVVVVKKSWHKRVVDSFFTGRADVAAEYVVQDVLLPNMRNALLDAGTSFLDGLINGNRAARTVANRVMPGQSVGAYVNNQMTAYNKVGNQIPGAPSRPGNPLSIASRARHDFGQLKFQTRVEAETVIANLLSRIQEYNAVTISDLYELCGITADYTDDKYGWMDIRGAGVMPARGGGFYLDLPSPVVLD